MPDDNDGPVRVDELLKRNGGYPGEMGILCVGRVRMMLVRCFATEKRFAVSNCASPQ